MISKKSQSAMEYLMTYGWAILVVLIALGALFYLGVFSPKTANSCVASSPITCTDVKLAGNTLNVVIGATGVSSTPADNTVGVVTWNTPTMTGCTWTTNTIATTNPIALILTCTGTAPAKGTKFSATIPVTYKLIGSTIPHIVDMQISGASE